MFAEFTLSFSSYLNSCGFRVTADRITRALSLFGEDISCTDNEQLVAVYRFCFCSRREEADALPSLLEKFVSDRERAGAAEQAKEEAEQEKNRKEEEEQAFSIEISSMDESIGRMREKIRNISDETLKNWRAQVPLTKKEQEFLAKNAAWIRKNAGEEAVSALEGKTGIDGARKAECFFLSKMEEALRKGRTQDLKKWKALAGMLKKAHATAEDGDAGRSRAVRDATKAERAELERLEKERKKRDREHAERQYKIDKRIRELLETAQVPVIQKEMSLTHRPEFTGGYRAVRTWGGMQVPSCADKAFNSLTQAEKRELEEYIRSNLVRFRTQLNRRLTDYSRGQTDVSATVREACRYGGVPMRICRQLRRPGKTNMVLVLDVSGSCKQASVMMLTFMHILQEVFPRGCRAFAFVNSLYDITGVMSSKNAQEAAEGVLSMIPRAGQYSNYERPITALWDEKKHMVNRESILIFMGDARNNRNGTAETEFKSLARRAKRTYWLNTDERGKWGRGDSIAGVYARYCRMYEARKVVDLLRFIDTGMEAV